MVVDNVLSNPHPGGEDPVVVVDAEGHVERGTLQIADLRIPAGRCLKVFATAQLRIDELAIVYEGQGRSSCRGQLAVEEHRHSALELIVLRLLLDKEQRLSINVEHLLHLNQRMNLETKGPNGGPGRQLELCLGLLYVATIEHHLKRVVYRLRCRGCRATEATPLVEEVGAGPAAQTKQVPRQPILFEVQRPLVTSLDPGQEEAVALVDQVDKDAGLEVDEFLLDEVLADVGMKLLGIL